MKDDQQKVYLDVTCTNVGEDDTDSVGEFELAITPYVMGRLERMVAFEAEARTLFFERFPDAVDRHLWEGVELGFDGFKASCSTDIDCKAIKLLDGEVVLYANLKNESTRIESEVISSEVLNEKFVELRGLMMSEATAGAVNDAVESGGALVGVARKAMVGMSL